LRRLFARIWIGFANLVELLVLYFLYLYNDMATAKGKEVKFEHPVTGETITGNLIRDARDDREDSPSSYELVIVEVEDDILSVPISKVIEGVEV